MPNFKVALPNGEEFDFEVLDGKDGLPGEKGEKGDTGPRGEKGEPGRDGIDGKDGINGINGRDGLDGKDGKDGRDGKDGKDGVDAKFSPVEIKKIAKELSKDSNLAWQTVPHMKSVVAGENIIVDNTDPINPKISSTGTQPSWSFYATTWSTEPTLNSSIAGGDVYDYTLDGVTLYRFVPTTYDPTQDAFYSTFSAGVLSDIIVTRG